MKIVFLRGMTLSKCLFLLDERTISDKLVKVKLKNDI